MTRTQIRIISTLFAAALTVSSVLQGSPDARLLSPALTAYAEDAPESGICGENITWQFDSRAGTLTIEGTGVLKNTPWVQRYDETARLSGYGQGWSDAFARDIRDVVISEGITELDWHSFYQCSGIVSVSLPDGLTRIGKGAFNGCTSLLNLNIPESVEQIDAYAFDDTPWIAVQQAKNPLVIINQIVVTGNTCTDEVIIPDGVKKIGGSAFSDASDITAVHIPETVTSIGEAAFSGCSSLTALNIPDSAVQIGEYAFISCSNLTEVHLPAGLTVLENDLFNCCKSLTGIEIPETVTSVGNNVFYGCISLESISFPESITTIGDNTFYKCKNLKTVSLPKALSTIGTDFFLDCESLCEVSMPESLTSIGDYAFKNCQKLEAIEIPDGTVSIGTRAFMFCSSLKEITFPLSCSLIGCDVLQNCAALKTVTILNPDAALTGGYTTEHGFAENYSDHWAITNNAASQTANTITNDPVFSGTIRGYLRSTAEAFASGYCNFSALAAEQKTVSFDAGGGKGTLDSLTLDFNTEYTLPECPFTPPAGKIFACWEIDGEIFRPGEKIRITDHITLIAKWKSTASVTFDANGGSGSMNEVSVKLGSTYKLPDCKFTAPAGKAFRGWKLNGETLQPGDTITVSVDTVITARWDGDCVVTFETNGGSGYIPPISVEKDCAIVLPECTFLPPDGMIFSDWRIDEVIDGARRAKRFQPGDELTVTEDTVVSAYWDSKALITFDANGGSGTMKPIEARNGAMIDIPECTFTPPEGKVFWKWRVDNWLTDMTTYPGLKIKSADGMCFTALWEDACTVTFDPNGGSCTVESIIRPANETYPLKSDMFIAPEGAAFAGWQIGEDIYENDGSGYSVMITGDIVIKALWKYPPCKITYDANGGTGETESKTVEGGAELTLGKCKFTAPEGAKFIGWEIDGTVYEVGDSVIIKKDTVIRAIWLDPEHPADGDYNADGIVTVADAVLLARFIAEDDTLPAEQITGILAAKPDLNGDGIVNYFDVSGLLNSI